MTFFFKRRAAWGTPTGAPRPSSARAVFRRVFVSGVWRGTRGGARRDATETEIYLYISKIELFVVFAKSSYTRIVQHALTRAGAARATRLARLCGFATPAPWPSISCKAKCPVRCSASTPPAIIVPPAREGAEGAEAVIAECKVSAGLGLGAAASTRRPGRWRRLGGPFYHGGSLSPDPE